MLKTSQIRADLKEIRYYYKMKKLFDDAEKLVKPEIVINKVERYGTIMKTAPAKLFVIFYALYVDGKTHQKLAEDWNYSREYITRLNDALVIYLQKNLI